MSSRPPRTSGTLTDIVAVAAPKECSRLIAATGSWRKEDWGRRTGFPRIRGYESDYPCAYQPCPYKWPYREAFRGGWRRRSERLLLGRQIGSRHTEVLRRTNKGLRNSKRRRLCHRYFARPDRCLLTREQQLCARAGSILSHCPGGQALLAPLAGSSQLFHRFIVVTETDMAIPSSFTT